jgi:hypothetical protein|tara:strand:- start:2332 stop:2583 length:252 start_codon:yes stop_codon:yes gene_type:complete
MHKLRRQYPFVEGDHGWKLLKQAHEAANSYRGWVKEEYYAMPEDIRPKEWVTHMEKLTALVNAIHKAQMRALEASIQLYQEKK